MENPLRNNGLAETTVTAQPPDSVGKLDSAPRFASAGFVPSANETPAASIVAEVAAIEPPVTA